jgi:hypothetical protein
MREATAAARRLDDEAERLLQQAEEEVGSRV